MIGLAIHTTSPELGLALTNFETEARSQVLPLGRDLTAYLHSALKAFIQPYTWQDLGLIAIAKGPGGFTGTRIGVVVARTLAQQLSIPLFGISSLDAIAHHHYQAHPALTHHALTVTLPAQRGEVFGAVYRWQEKTLACQWPAALYAEADWTTQIQSLPPPVEHVRTEGGLAHTVTGVLSLAEIQWRRGDCPSWETVLPYYGQHPVASHSVSQSPTGNGC
jgi:tRNA threonylcarbamoyl adenosine modification protein YeaZ